MTSIARFFTSRLLAGYSTNTVYHTDCEEICKLGLKAKILTHIRCHMDDARIAEETGTSYATLATMNGRTEERAR